MDTKKYLMEIYGTLLDHFGPRGWWPAQTPLEVCIGAILTQNTAWKNVEKAMDNLRRLGVSFTSVDEILRLPEEELKRAIRPSGYYNQKARRLLEFLEYVSTNYGSVEAMLEGDTWEKRKELLSLRGIGRETADSMLLYAGGHLIFVVDAYTFRLVERAFATAGIDLPRDYDTVQRFFMDHLPPDLELYNDYHAQIVALGNQYCKRKPRCNDCPLKSVGLCLYMHGDE